MNARNVTASTRKRTVKLVGFAVVAIEPAGEAAEPDPEVPGHALHGERRVAAVGRGQAGEER